MEEPSETDIDRGDQDAGTDVDEEYYQEAFFPSEGGDSQSEPEEEPGGFLYDGAGGDGGNRGGATVAGVEEDGRADSLV